MNEHEYRIVAEFNPMIGAYEAVLQKRYPDYREVGFWGRPARVGWAWGSPISGRESPRTTDRKLALAWSKHYGIPIPECIKEDGSKA